MEYIYLIIGVVIMILEFLIGKTDKFKANSIIEAILNVLKSIANSKKKKD